MFSLFRKPPPSWITPGGTVYNLYEQMTQETHLLIAGSTGSGKSCAMAGIMNTLLKTCSPAKAQFILLDPKMTELKEYSTLPHVITYACRNEEIISALHQTISIMEQRLEYMQRKRIKYYDGPAIYVIIDELAHLMLVQKRTCAPLLQQILQLARAANIHVFACTQVTLATVIKTELRINFTGIVGLKVPNKRDSTFITGTPGAERFPDPQIDHVAWCYYRHGCACDLYILPYIQQQEIDETIEYWARQAKSA